MATSWLVVLDGQSNAWGDGPVAGASAETLALLEPTGPNYWYTGEASWGSVLIAKKQAAHIGPEHTLARDIYDNLPDGDSLYLYDNSNNGSSMNARWDVTHAHQSIWNTTTVNSQNALDLIPGKVAFGGFVFAQGEGDAGTEAYANEYAAALERCRRNWMRRFSLDMSNAPLVIYRLPSWQTMTYLSTVRAAQDALDAAHSNVTTISSDSTTDNGDGLHLDADSQAAMGSLYAVPIIDYITAADTSGGAAKGSPVIRTS